MTNLELFERFTRGQATTEDIAAMYRYDQVESVREFRSEGSLENLPASDEYLARKIQQYAKGVS